MHTNDSKGGCIYYEPGKNRKAINVDRAALCSHSGFIFRWSAYANDIYPCMERVCVYVTDEYPI